MGWNLSKPIDFCSQLLIVAKLVALSHVTWKRTKRTHKHTDSNQLC